MKATTGSAVILLLVFLIGACTRAGHIAREEPIRTLNFKGDHRQVAQCVQQRLGGKVQDVNFGEKFVIFQSAKGMSSEGLTHHSVTVGRYSPEEGFAEWRVVRTPAVGPSSSWQTRPPLTDTAVRQLWGPVEECAAQAQRGS